LASSLQLIYLCPCLLHFFAYLRCGKQDLGQFSFLLPTCFVECFTMCSTFRFIIRFTCRFVSSMLPSYCFIQRHPHSRLPGVTNLLFFFASFSDMRLPYVLHFTYLNMSLPAGEHESPNTRITCVCLMVDIPFSSVHHASNLLIMHVHVTFSLLFKPVVSCSVSLASH
jgi:hypothetical protein